MKTEILPFTVRPVRDRRAMDRAVHTRHHAYARHLPTLAATMTGPDDLDAGYGVIVLLAESKLDGSSLGTIRIHCNEDVDLPLEKSVDLPNNFLFHRLAEATRLAVTGGVNASVVKNALFKAFFQYCLKNDIHSAVIAGRPPLDRMYERLMFQEVFPGEGCVDLLHAGNLPHRIMFLDIKTAAERWQKAAHPMFEYFMETHHPDLNFDLGDIPIAGEADDRVLSSTKIASNANYAQPPIATEMH